MIELNRVDIATVHEEGGKDKTRHGKCHRLHTILFHPHESARHPTIGEITRYRYNEIRDNEIRDTR